MKFWPPTRGSRYGPVRAKKNEKKLPLQPLVYELKRRQFTGKGVHGPVSGFCRRLWPNFIFLVAAHIALSLHCLTATTALITLLLIQCDRVCKMGIQCQHQAGIYNHTFLGFSNGCTWCGYMANVLVRLEIPKVSWSLVMNCSSMQRYSERSR